MPKGTNNLGWCLTGHHIGRRYTEQAGPCPGRVWDQVCSCWCHSDPRRLKAEESLDAGFLPQVANLVPAPEPKKPLVLRKRKKVRKNV